MKKTHVGDDSEETINPATFRKKAILTRPLCGFFTMLKEKDG